MNVNLDRRGEWQGLVVLLLVPLTPLVCSTARQEADTKAGLSGFN